MDYSYNLNLGTSDNGNVYKISNNRTNASDRNINYTYDSLNRIAAAYTDGNLWGETYSIDAWGNLYGIGPYTGKPAGESLSQGVTAANQFTNACSANCYDLAGNLLNDGLHSYAYDAESRIHTGAGVSYTYDGDGKRVQKSTGTLYWYGMGSEALEETDAGGNLTNEYIFFGGKRIARRDSSGNVFYYFADHLGTSRAIVQAGQTTPCYDQDFYPYGREVPHGSEVPAFVNTCPQNYKFTGKERDSESGLDNFGARYDSSQYGRFMTPDPLMASAHVSNPQTWNRYSYALNNPLRLVDPNGMDPCGKTAGDYSECKVTIRVNVIYDKNANNGKGLTDKQKSDFEKGVLAKATKDFGKTGIGLQATYTAGSMKQSSDGTTTFEGTQSNSLNVFVTNSLASGNAGDSPQVNNGQYLSLISADDEHTHNAFPFFTNTVEHEFIHQLNGDTQGPNMDPFSYTINEFAVDVRAVGMGWGVKQGSLVSGAENKPFTVQPTQDKIQPRTDK